MAKPIQLRQGDLKPDLIIQIKEKGTNVPIDLSAATTTVEFKFRARNTTTILETVACSKIDSGFSGAVRMVWPAASLDIDAGEYEGEVAVSFNSKVQTVLDLIEFDLVEDF